MTILLLTIALALSLLAIPFGLPGTWLMALAAFLADRIGDVHIGATALVGSALIALVAELLDITLSARYTRKYGGSSRGAWGAIVGGLVGAVVGVPVPLVGSVLGALGGSFAGALAFELWGGATHGAATRAATGAAIGRAVAMASKAGAGCVIAAWVLGAALL
ncbi:MAG: DUF456 domain-containing protein [Gemmatimonadetes bacterium]|nr:DUF456 domain-containing protein [Gemmatimonadota bacterium]